MTAQDELHPPVDDPRWSRVLRYILSAWRMLPVRARLWLVGQLYLRAVYKLLLLPVMLVGIFGPGMFLQAVLVAFLDVRGVDRGTMAWVVLGLLSPVCGYFVVRSVLKHERAWRADLVLRLALKLRAPTGSTGIASAHAQSSAVVSIPGAVAAVPALPGPGEPRAKKRMSAVELMIVVAIVGILAAIALPSYVRFGCRARQAEAKSGLKAIAAAERAYLDEHGVYASFNELLAAGVLELDRVTSRRYTFDVTTDGAAFTATAYGFVQDSKEDGWTLSSANTLVSPVIDGCNP